MATVVGELPAFLREDHPRVFTPAGWVRACAKQHIARDAAPGELRVLAAIGQTLGAADGVAIFLPYRLGRRCGLSDGEIQTALIALVARGALVYELLENGAYRITACVGYSDPTGHVPPPADGAPRQRIVELECALAARHDAVQRAGALVHAHETARSELHGRHRTALLKLSLLAALLRGDRMRLFQKRRRGRQQARARWQHWTAGWGACVGEGVGDVYED